MDPVNIITNAGPSPAILAALEKQWTEAWPKALATWSKFTRLRPPMYCTSDAAAEAEGLTQSFAAIRLRDQAIIINLQQVIECGVQDYALEILAHEIGHHVLAPATLTDQARMIARMRWALPTIEHQAPIVANLYTDLLINDRLQRVMGHRHSEIYEILGRDKKVSSATWRLYMRIYEILWRLKRDSLNGSPTDDRIEGDAWLGARLVRSFAKDWLEGSGRFAALLLPHLLEDKEPELRIQKWLDLKGAGAGGDASGVTVEDPNERAGAIHPADDPELSGFDEKDEPPPEDVSSKVSLSSATSQKSQSGGQARQPFAYGEILRAIGITIDDHEAAVRYYKERARAHLIPFPSHPTPPSLDPLPEGLEPWSLGDALDDADWIQTVLQSPRIIPGLTTVRRVWGSSPGTEPERIPLDLDLYVDSSGSMPNPQRHVSYLTLAGAIVALSALRAGARVQVTLWSGTHQFTMTNGFVRDETAILRILTGFYGGATAFPIHVLRDTYANRAPSARSAHILVISDDGVSTLFDNDEQGNSGWDISARVLKQAKGGGTFVLNLSPTWETYAQRVKITNAHPYSIIKRARDEGGWNVHAVSSWEQLVDFARDFSRMRYGTTPAVRAKSKASTP